MRDPARRLMLGSVAGLVALAASGAAGYGVWRRGKVQQLLGPQRDTPNALGGWTCPPDANASVVLLGDSRISRWQPAPVVAPGLSVVNRGTGGETLRQLSHRFAHDGTACRPHAIVLQTGVNDLVAASFLGLEEADTVCRATVERLLALADACSGAGVALLVMTIIPPGRPTLLYRVEGVDRLVRLVARVNDLLLKQHWPARVWLLDPRDQLSTDGGLTLRREFQRDTLHLTADAYVALNKVMLQALSKLPVPSAA